MQHIGGVGGGGLHEAGECQHGGAADRTKFHCFHGNPSLYVPADMPE
jgi:hypothetical protein